MQIKSSASPISAKLSPGPSSRDAAVLDKALANSGGSSVTASVLSSKPMPGNQAQYISTIKLGSGEVLAIISDQRLTAKTNVILSKDANGQLKVSAEPSQANTKSADPSSPLRQDQTLKSQQQQNQTQTQAQTQTQPQGSTKTISAPNTAADILNSSPLSSNTAKSSSKALGVTIDALLRQTVPRQAKLPGLIKAIIVLQQSEQFAALPKITQHAVNQIVQQLPQFSPSPTPAHLKPLIAQFQQTAASIPAPANNTVSARGLSPNTPNVSPSLATSSAAIQTIKDWHTQINHLNPIRSSSASATSAPLAPAIKAAEPLATAPPTGIAAAIVKQGGQTQTSHIASDVTVASTPTSPVTQSSTVLAKDLGSKLSQAANQLRQQTTTSAPLDSTKPGNINTSTSPLNTTSKQGPQTSTAESSLTTANTPKTATGNLPLATLLASASRVLSSTNAVLGKLDKPLKHASETSVKLTNTTSPGTSSSPVASTNSAEQQALISRLLQILLAASSRTQMNQLLSAQASTSDSPTLINHWQFDLPFLYKTEPQHISFTLEEHQHPTHQENEEQLDRRWRILMGFELDRAGDIFFELSLINQRVSTFVWADQESTYTAIKQQLTNLHDAFIADGIEVEDLNCFLGKSPYQGTKIEQQLVDLHT